METVCLHAVLDALQGFIFSLNFGHNGSSIDFEFCTSLVVVAVSFHFGVCSGVFKAMRCFSQGVVGSPPGLEEFNEPLR